MSYILAALHYAESLFDLKEEFVMPKKENITLTPEELQLLLEAMEDEEFIMSIPLLLEDIDKGEFDAEKEII